MKKQYDGLEAIQVPIKGSDIMTTASSCVASITNKLENGVCVSDFEHQIIEYVGEVDPDW